MDPKPIFISLWQLSVFWIVFVAIGYCQIPTPPPPDISDIIIDGDPDAEVLNGGDPGSHEIHHENIHKTGMEMKINELEEKINRELEYDKYVKSHTGPDTKPLDPEDDLTEEELKLAKEQDMQIWSKQNQSTKREANDFNMGNRRKRFVLSDKRRQWDKGIVPFVYDTTVSEFNKNEIEIAMRTIESRSCIRFVPWTNETNVEYGLGHEGHMKFINEKSGCWAVQGKSNNIKGQRISCCNRSPCIHEIGHVLSLVHEHQSPAAEGWVRMNFDNIKSDSRGWFKSYKESSSTTYGYDMNHIMHYNTWGFNIDGLPSQLALDSSQKIGGDNLFYYFQDVAFSHDCKGLECSNFTGTCENDGFVTVVNDQCSCLCADGLDSSTGCTTIKPREIITEWPGGSYAMFATAGGCSGDSFKNGTLTHYSDGSNWNSYTWKNGDSHIGGSLTRSKNTYNFCVMENNEGFTEWGRGDYCIFRKGGSCPSGFSEGFVQYDDELEDGETNSNSGSIPDGEFIDDTKFYFCCRDDGFTSDPLQIPNQDPLILFSRGTCQAVEGMGSHGEYFLVDNINNSNISAKEGALPKISHYRSTNGYMIYICYYEPLNTDCGGVIELSAQNPTTTITSPNYPENYDNNRECIWLVKAPVGDRLILRFDDFDIEQNGNTCHDTLTINNNRPGQPGQKVCGNRYPMNVRSLNNTIKLTFTSGMQGQRKGFKAIITHKTDADLCFVRSDKGATYDGDVNFTRTGRQCLPWAAVTHCPHNIFNTNGGNLESNYCRNPANGLEPWCYYQSEGCLRDYCDVCQDEPVYDLYDDCATSKTNGFCSHKVARHGCAKTCSSELSQPTSPVAVRDVQCNLPPTVSDATLQTTSKTKFDIGENVVYTCNNGTATAKRTCLTSGKWSDLGYVCGACSHNYRRYNNQCYTFVNEKMKYNEAEDKCRSLGGIIAPTKDQKQLEFVSSLGNSAKIHLGAKDNITEGQWVWSDGDNATWTNWKSNQPDNWNNKEHCASIDSSLKWNDLYCDSSWYKYPFVCMIGLEAKQGCVDKRGDCEQILEQNPSFCSDHPNFKTEDCPFTCGECGTANQCSLPPSANTTLITSGVSSLSRGQQVEYKCEDGYAQTGGNRKRACLSNGELTGLALQCQGINETSTKVNNVTLTNRGSIGWGKHTFVGNNTNLRIERSGVVSQWQFYCRFSGQVAFQVWRMITTNSYEFVGQNVITTKGNRVEYVDVESSNRITVKSGDLIGFWYGNPKAEIPYDKCDDRKLPGGLKLYRLKKSSATDFKVGTSYTFKAEKCRIFSFNAVISPV